EVRQPATALVTIFSQHFLAANITQQTGAQAPNAASRGVTIEVVVGPPPSAVLYGWDGEEWVRL
ncbi:MAG: hypothetical protein J2P39_09600, partial [Candidatus Dormibacteraeota bacterium]|nr:hypothetical protein [Candidatus Dormibacteraeota bacterium]